MTRTAETLTEYIARCHNGSQSEYARSIGVSRQAVNKWKDRIVVGGKIYSYRRHAERRR